MAEGITTQRPQIWRDLSARSQKPPVRRSLVVDEVPAAKVLRSVQAPDPNVKVFAFEGYAASKRTVEPPAAERPPERAQAPSTDAVRHRPAAPPAWRPTHQNALPPEVLDSIRNAVSEHMKNLVVSRVPNPAEFGSAEAQLNTRTRKPYHRIRPDGTAADEPATLASRRRGLSFDDIPGAIDTLLSFQTNLKKVAI